MADAVRFDGRVAVVTGAGGGLGREYALLLAARGARVLVNDLGGNPLGGDPSGERAEVVVEEIHKAGGEALADASDVASSEGGRALVECALSRWGRVDALINNAGVVGGAPHFDELSDADVDRMLRVHVYGAFNVSRPAWRAMRAQRYGRILFTSSGSVFGTGGPVTYPTAKAALIGLTRNLALEGRRVGIKVNAIMPVAHTRLTAMLPDRPLVEWLAKNFSPARVAPLAAWLVHEDVPCSGEVFSAGGGRFARVFLGVTRGVAEAELTLESVRDGFARALDASSHVIPSEASEELALFPPDGQRFARGLRGD
jgi:NAD(P)-dependent dehydrogenase (short-subunit alcohol dehydrogenase family)